MEYQLREKSGHLNTPFIGIPVPQSTSERGSSPERAPLQTPQKQSGPFPQLPLQTYLHLALACPETPATAQPAVAPALPLEMKYPYVPSDSPDLILERITNFLFLPPYLEKVLLFGMLACLDSWLYTFTILPLRFFRALGLLISYWLSATASFWKGGNRLQKRKPVDNDTVATYSTASNPTKRTNIRERVRRKQRESKISSLRPQHKADLLKGSVVMITCFMLMKFDASRMYHSIRGQAAIKLYVIYNVLEVGDRLLSALGQDIFECLCSKDTLERKPNGRSKVWRPFWCFVLAAAYNVLHSTCLFYQMVTLNVAVNSYSNALLTLLLSNQFVEIKSTVFKRFEKENLFQITCADIVERFQLWLMLSIIISRNLIELGVRSSSEMFASPIGVDGFNATHTPSSSGGVVTPKSFLIFPSWAGQVLGPFLMVLGSETLVDWLKHAYITKFNQIRPKIYETFLDVLCRDYYSYAFADQNLTRRFGLPVIPLACLFIRASMQTYQMFIATRITAPIPIFTSTTTSLQGTHTSSPAAAAALGKFDQILRRTLGSSAIPPDPIAATTPSRSWLSLLYFNARFADDVIAATTLVVFFLGVFFLFLAVKLVLGMAMVGYATGRYKGMKEREKEDVLTGGRRVGGFGLVEVDEGKRKAIYTGDREGEERVRGWEVKAREREVEGALGNQGKNGKAPVVRLDKVERYSMVAKRIW
ncbi:eukaryotic membrane protein family-domain-containing protein [Terfezia claveryi]|nr:eukaryotic membrane protein family-domain-containing protein [Terfezia claveryi]